MVCCSITCEPHRRSTLKCQSSENLTAIFRVCFWNRKNRKQFVVNDVIYIDIRAKWHYVRMFGSIAMWIWPAAPQNTGTNYAWCTVYGVVGTNGTLHRRTSNIRLWECTHSHQAHATCAKGFDRYNHLLPCWRFRGPFFPLFPILLGLCASCMSINTDFCYICVSFNQVYGLMVRTLIPPPSNRFCVCFFLISFSCGCCCRLSRIIIIILLLFFVVACLCINRLCTRNVSTTNTSFRRSWNRTTHRKVYQSVSMAAVLFAFNFCCFFLCSTFPLSFSISLSLTTRQQCGVVTVITMHLVFPCTQRRRALARVYIIQFLILFSIFFLVVCSTLYWFCLPSPYTLYSHAWCLLCT